MAAPQKFLLRVYLDPDVAMKLSLDGRPESVEELKRVMQEKYKPRLDSDFSLQYEDPDFDGQLTVLVDIEELPERGILKVIRTESNDPFTGSSDTDILPPHVPLTQREKNWPDPFPVPTFSYEVEYVLEQGKSVFEMSGKTLQLTRSQKHNVLESMAGTMYSFKPYPNAKELGQAAEALITSHPCLKELGSDSGWFGWKISLGFKMGNYRQKLARSGCAEVAINAGKRSKSKPENEQPHSNIKKAGHAEVNFLPNFPRGEDGATLERMRLQIKEEVEKTEKNLILIEKLMQMTFALRSKDIVENELPVKDYLNSWPALRMESQVCSEFHRITNVNLRNIFYSELDRYTPRLITLYRQKASRTGKIAEALREILKAYDLQEEHDVNLRRTLSLRALPVYLREDVSMFKIYNEEEEPDFDGPFALLTSGPDPYSCERVFVVVEGNIVLNGVQTFPEAFILLFGLIYAFNLEYPKKLMYTFSCIQNIFMCLDDHKPLKPSVLTFKNDLLK